MTDRVRAMQCRGRGRAVAKPLQSSGRIRLCERDLKSLAGLRQVGVMARISESDRPPARLQRLQLHAIAHLLRCRAIATAGFRFVMDEYGMRRKDVPPSRGAEFQTQIDIVERDGEVGFIESSDIQELALCNDETGRGDGTHVLGQVCMIEITWLVVAQIAMGVAGRVAESDDDARMLNAAIGI